MKGEKKKTIFIAAHVVCVCSERQRENVCIYKVCGFRY